MAQDTPDTEFIWSVIKWFLGGLTAVFSIIATTLLGRIYKEHNRMYEWYTSTIDPEKIKLKDKIDQVQQDSISKYHQDMQFLKHDFAQLKVQIAPILDMMANGNGIMDKLEQISSRLDRIERPARRTKI